MKITHTATISGSQDGAIWGNNLFRFNSHGVCRVFSLEDFSQTTSFTLHRAEEIAPHSNAVFFAPCKFHPEDEFPLLCSNIYNNYAKAEDKLKGVCCVYRLQRNGGSFETTLTGLIKIGFTDTALWCSFPEEDVRPYGNFVADREQNLLHVFTMRDTDQKTRYFTFNFPELSDCPVDPKLGIPVATLFEEDVLSYFDTEYHRFIQGACVYNGDIYSVEGFTDSIENPPALRIISPEEQRQKLYLPFSEFGLSEEAEFIDFHNGKCLYSDNRGKLYELEF